MQHYRQIIIGGTFYGCGRAAVSPGAVVLEAGNHVGSDAVFTFSPGSEWDAEPCHPLAAAFRERLIASNVLRGVRIQIGGLAPVFARWCLEQNLDIRLLSRVISQDDSTVTVLSPAGKETFTADTVIDARPRKTGRKRITALVKHDPQMNAAGEFGHFEIVPGPFEDESYLLMDVPEDTRWQEARERLHQAWQTRPEAFREWQLVLIGSRFDICQFPNPVAALDAGLRKECV